MPALPAQIAYVHAARHSQVWMMDADGGHRRFVIDDVETVSWSPDASRLAVSAARERGGGFVATLDPDGSDFRIVARVPDPVEAEQEAAASAATFSPDGTHLAFTSFGGYPTGDADAPVRDESHLVVMKTDGSDPRVVVTSGGTEIGPAGPPAWSADGTRLLYSRFVADRPDIHSVALDGSGDTEVLHDAVDPALSPDGSKIAFGSGYGRRFDIAVARADGSSRRVLLRTPQTPERDPSWSPDGTRIAFSSSRNAPRRNLAAPEIYSVAPDGRCLTWLTNGDRASSLPAWMPGAGPAAPRHCGHRRRRPTIEESPPPGTAFWLGARYGRTLVTFARPQVAYLKCGAYDAAGCPTAVLSPSRSCGRYPEHAEALARAATGGGLVDGKLLLRGQRPVAVVGRTVLALYLTRPGEARGVVRRIRRVSGAAIGAPRLPASAIALLPKPLRTLVRRC